MRFEHEGGYDWVGSVVREQLVRCGRDVSVAEGIVADSVLLLSGELEGGAERLRGVANVEDWFRIGVGVGKDCGFE